MSFHKDGKFLAVSSDDGTLHIYNAMTASITKNIFCKKYGIDLVKYTHIESSVISASRNGWDGKTKTLLSPFTSTHRTHSHSHSFSLTHSFTQ